MSKFFYHLSGLSAITACLLASGAAQALEPFATEPTALKAPVAATEPALPTNSSLATLQSLNSRYGCSSAKLEAGATREQIHAAMGECLEAMEAKIANQPNSVTQEDLAQLKSLAIAFRNEAGELNQRLNKIEERVAQAPADSFSTTTKLAGEAIIAMNDVFGNASGSTNTTIANRVRLNFRTSFTGKDMLITRLQARNTISFSGGGAANTPMVRLGFEGDEGNAEYIHLLQYQFPAGPNTRITANTVGNEPDGYLYKNFNPVLAPAGQGAISRFGRFNPIYRLSGEGAGITVDHKFSREFGLAVGYGVPKNIFVDGIASNPANPVNPTVPPAPSLGSGGGLFNGSNLLFSQLSYSPNDNVDLGLIYARTYHAFGGGVSGGTGSTFANSPFGTAPTAANHFSLMASTKLSPTVVLSGWAGLTNATRETPAGGSADMWNGAVNVAFNDVGGKGSTLGFVVGITPNVTSNSGDAARRDFGTPMHLETFYRYKLSDNLSITPGVVLILNPNVGASPTSTTNNSLVLGTIRTTFTF